MKNQEKIKQVKRLRRHKRVRAKILGTAKRPRLCVFRSLTQTYGQLIDDTSGKVFLAVSDKNLKSSAKAAKKAKAREIGKLLAEKAKVAGITEVVFDRGPYRYHGRVKELADGAREGGLKF